MNKKVNPLMRVSAEFVDLIEAYKKDFQNKQGVSPSKTMITKHIAETINNKKTISTPRRTRFI